MRKACACTPPDQHTPPDALHTRTSPTYQGGELQRSAEKHERAWTVRGPNAKSEQRSEKIEGEWGEAVRIGDEANQAKIRSKLGRGVGKGSSHAPRPPPTPAPLPTHTRSTRPSHNRCAENKEAAVLVKSRGHSRSFVSFCSGRSPPRSYAWMRSPPLLTSSSPAIWQASAAAWLACSHLDLRVLNLSTAECSARHAVQPRASGPGGAPSPPPAPRPRECRTCV